MRTEETTEMRVWRDLVYTELADRELHLDLYCPKDGEEGAPLKPVIIWIHGGAWREGSKENPRGLRFVKRGYGLASINYRLSREAKFPAQLQDCKDAVRWLQAHAEGYGLDPARIAVWGGSAGLPPFLLMHGTADDVVLASQSRMFDQALSEVRADSTLVLLDGLNHGFTGDHGRWDEIWSAMDGFFDRLL